MCYFAMSYSYAAARLIIERRRDVEFATMFRAMWGERNAA